MENPIILNSRLKFKRSAIANNGTKLAELEAKKTELLRAADAAKSEEDLDKVSKDATDVDDQIKKIKDDTATLEQDVADLEDALEQNNEDPEPTPNQNSKKGGKTRMHKVDSAETRSVIEYINSKGQTRDGIKTTDIGAIIPQQIIYDAEEEVKTAYDLSQYVDVIHVSQQGGTYSVLKKVDTTLHTVEELEANPDLGKPDLLNVPWTVATYRGAVTSSNESLEDATDLKRILADILGQVVLNTKNRIIMDSLITAPAKTAADADGIKHIINVDLDPAYNKMIITSQSGFQFLDTLKDNNGRYLMQPDVTSPTGYRFLGMVVQPVADILFGKQGNAIAFIGDAKRFTKLFDRNELQIGWATNEKYGQSMLAAIRAVVKTADTNAGYLVSLGSTDSTTTPSDTPTDDSSK